VRGDRPHGEGANLAEIDGVAFGELMMARRVRESLHQFETPLAHWQWLRWLDHDGTETHGIRSERWLRFGDLLGPGLLRLSIAHLEILAGGMANNRYDTFGILLGDEFDMLPGIGGIHFGYWSVI
jgi:hypothetical protein